MKTIKLKLLLLFFLVLQCVYSQNPAFDSLADEINRISLYKKTKSFELLDSLYKMAYNDPDSSLLFARCLYKEALIKSSRGLIDTLLTARIKDRLHRENLPILERAILQSALGLNLSTTQEYAEAFTVQLQALEKYKQLENNRFIARTLNSLGNCCNILNLHHLAEYYYLEAITFITPEMTEYYGVKNNLFRILAFKNKNAAIDSLYLLIEAAENNFFYILPYLYLNIGSDLLDSLPDKALNYFSKMQALDFDNLYLTAALYINFGNFYYNKKDYKQALHYYRLSRKIAVENNDTKNLVLTYFYLSRTFEGINMLDSALLYSQKSLEMTQQLSSNTIAIETHQKYITTFLEASQKDLIIAEQKIELKNKQFIIIIIISVSGILLILLFLLYINRQKQLKIIENREITAKLEYEEKMKQSEKRERKLEKEKQDEIIKSKTREIITYLVLVSNKNHILKRIIQLITNDDNKKANNQNNQETLSKIKEIVKSSLDVDDEWNKFKMHFDKVHPDFFRKLKQKCTDLTDENLKMCAYIKMRMSTKQISQLLNVIPKTVTISRYRIKKKLNLTEEEDLDSFIEKL